MHCPKWEKLAAAAAAAGHAVTRETDRIYIRTGKTDRSVGLVLYPNGTAARLDVPAENTLTIRTAAEARNALNLQHP